MNYLVTLCITLLSTVVMSAPLFISPNAPEINVTGYQEKIFSRDGIVFSRFTEKEHDSLPIEEISQASVTLEVKTKSPFVSFSFVRPGECERDPHFALYRDGELVKDRINDLTVRGVNKSKKEVLWKVVLPGSCEMKFTGLEIAKGSKLAAVKKGDNPLYIALGDIISIGTGEHGAHSHCSYAWHIADAYGYELLNLSSINGVSSAPKLPAKSPALVTLLFGDQKELSVEEQLIAYRELLNSVSSNYPEAKILAILQPLEADKSERCSALRKGQKLAINNIMGKHFNVQLIDGASFIGAAHLNDSHQLSEVGSETLAAGILLKMAGLISFR